MKIKASNWKLSLYIVAGILAVLYGLQIIQAPETVLDDVIVFEEGDKLVVQIKFNLPVRYENHFPEGFGDFLQIKVRIVSLMGGKTNEYLNRDAILPGFIERVPIVGIAYEGNVPGGPFLSLKFSDPIKFQVGEDLNTSSIVIHVPKVL